MYVLGGKSAALSFLRSFLCDFRKYVIACTLRNLEYSPPGKAGFSSFWKEIILLLL